MAKAAKQGMFGLAGFGPLSGAGGRVDEKPMSGLADLLAAYEPKRGNWADAAGMLGGLLMDLDGTLGAGNAQAANERFRDFRKEDQARFQANQQQKIVQAAAAGDAFALALMDPLGNRAFETGRADRKEDLGREDAAIKRDEDWRLKDFLHEKGIADQTQSNWESEFEENKRQFDDTIALDREAATAKGVPEMGDVWTQREAFEKRAQAFESAQRSFYSMQDYANDGTGASDVALGYAFFKTLDPNSTVRESEFAATASAMGLGGRFVSAFEKLKNGQQFTPELRQDLVNAARTAYDQQRIDIEGLFEREGQFAERFGVPSSLVARNPVRGRDGGEAVDAPVQVNVPASSLAVGTVVDGFEYVGGDPRDPTSWRPASDDGVPYFLRPEQ